MSETRPLSTNPTAVYMRGYYARRRAAGLCVRCKEPNDRPGVTYCSRCRDKMRTSTRNSNLRSYGVTLEPASLDHDHVSGKVRGVLDRMCNQALGLLGDDIAGTEAAVKYLKTRV